jgi:uncharacterized surface protein with fasciclin (FAS1) repeats
MSQEKKRVNEVKGNRRGFLKTGGVATGAVVLSQTEWAKPVINSVVLPAHAQTSDPATVVDIALGANPEFTTLVSLLTDAGLVPTLQGDGPFTVFAPTNAAFDAISGTLAGLSPAQVEEVLLYHVIIGSIGTAADLPATTGAAATVTGGPLSAQNGVVFIIDQVLLP